MKKTAMLITTFYLLLTLTACGQSSTSDTQSETFKTAVSTEAVVESDIADVSTENKSTGVEVTEIQTAESTSSSHILVAYFSLPETDGVDASSGASRVVIDGELKGAMQYMAEVIAGTTGGELFRIETVQTYPSDHSPLIEQAKEEQNQNARPELAAHIENPEDFDIIYLGYPNWWADMPQALYTFLEEYDFSGKTIIPFNSHGGSRFSRTIETIQEMQPTANVITNGFTVSRDNVASCADDLNEWVNHLPIDQ